ncbi:hypothetical protein KSP40_PGU016219 [Platanthera guangdongensis]|uniref:glucose-6-phosphate dehydrogenase (NADP(+)) n=1 Tax=Platanthera guangdongensis TaxID=2320717 RepID=A0ABR2LGN6_9ASPA
MFPAGEKSDEVGGAGRNRTTIKMSRSILFQARFIVVSNAFLWNAYYARPNGQGAEAGRISNRMFYLSVPPNVFIDVVKCASKLAFSLNGWTRVIVEKPFGRDSESSAALTRNLKQYLEEDQIFRIDHYLGKELVENLSVLRFTNLVFEFLWSSQYIQNVQLIFSEDFGIEGRGRYFDNYGIIRDIMQNHLLQILALFAMETPVSLDAEDIRNEKVKVLRCMKPLLLDDVVIGQYKSHTKDGISYPAYIDDKTVANDSLTPTFAAAAAIFINNARWDGVPFLMKAGKALHTKGAQIRVQFRHVPGNLYKKSFGTDLDRANELVIRMQPDEAIYLKINNKIPGLGVRLDRSNLNLHYAASSLSLSLSKLRLGICCSDSTIPPAVVITASGHSYDP